MVDQRPNPGRLVHVVVVLLPYLAESLNTDGKSSSGHGSSTMPASA